MYKECAAIAECGNAPIHLQQLSDKIPTSSLQVTKRTRIDLIHLGGGIMFPRQCILPFPLHHPGGKSQTVGGRGAGQLHHGVNSDFLVPDETFRLPEIQSPGNRRGVVIITPTAHTFFSCAVCQRSRPSLLSQFVLQVAVILSDSFHAHAWLKRNMKLGTLCLAHKCSRHRAPCHTLHP